MRLIKRVIRQEHVQSIIDGKLFFSPCRTFVDLLEFRFGYCWDSFELARAEGRPEIFERCVQKAFSDEHVQQRINETVISCWSYNVESPYMWEVYAQSKAAIIMTVKEDELVNYVKQHWGDNAATGAVKYAFETSSIFPEFIAPAHDPRWHKDFDLFFHKDRFYKFEQESRAVIFGHTKAVEMTLPDAMVQEITLSPLAPLERSLLAALKEQFGERVQDSRLHWSLEPPKTLSAEDYMLDAETRKTPEMIALFEKLKRLKSQDQTKGWVDPKGPPIPKEQRQVTKQILELERQLNQAIHTANKSALDSTPR
jgi:hypothetical protein